MSIIPFNVHTSVDVSRFFVVVLNASYGQYNKHRHRAVIGDSESNALLPVFSESRNVRVDNHINQCEFVTVGRACSSVF